MKKIVKLPVSLLAMAVIILFVVHGCKKDEADPSAIKDGDGNTYTSVSIGSQTWLNVVRLSGVCTKEKIFDRSKTLSEIAYELGFKSLQHFSRMFKNETGQTPNEYRSLA